MLLAAAIDERVCDGSEDIKTLQSQYIDTSQLRVTNMVYKAVYAIAHAIHNAVCQDTNSTTRCDKFSRIESKQVSQNELLNTPMPFSLYTFTYTFCHFSASQSHFTSSSQVLTQLKKVKFSQNGYAVSFDANGDPVATYELVNWQQSESGSIELVTVGHYDASLPVGQEFRINRNLTWVEGGAQVRRLKVVI